MTAEYARTEWDRALEAFPAATLLLAHGGFDSAASRAYYAVFHAANALFALEGRTFTKHSALEAAVHRDLVRREDGVRGVGDYGSDVRVDATQAEEATAAARRILVAISEAMPHVARGTSHVARCTLHVARCT